VQERVLVSGQQVSGQQVSGQQVSGQVSALGPVPPQELALPPQEWPVRH
jgi:hypothetical protein